jgi:hypothetical protein
MEGADVETRIAELADKVWTGLEAREELHKVIREHLGDPGLGPTRVAELSDYLWRPEHISRIAVSQPAKRQKRRRRAVNGGAAA